MTDFDLTAYTPEITDDNNWNEPFKGEHNCMVNYCRIEPYKGDKLEFKGQDFLRYELEVAADQENAGRRLWKSVNLNDEMPDKRGKTRIEKLADTFYRLGLTFNNQTDLQACITEFVAMTLTVSCHYFKGKEGENIQVHTIKGISSETVEKAPDSVPF